MGWAGGLAAAAAATGGALLVIRLEDWRRMGDAAFVTCSVELLIQLFFLAGFLVEFSFILAGT